MLSQHRLTVALGPLGAKPAICMSLPVYYLGQWFICYGIRSYGLVSFSWEKKITICLLHYCLWFLGSLENEFNISTLQLSSCSMVVLLKSILFIISNNAVLFLFYVNRFTSLFAVLVIKCSLVSLLITSINLLHIKSASTLISYSLLMAIILNWNILISTLHKPYTVWELVSSIKTTGFK